MRRYSACHVRIRLYPVLHTPAHRASFGALHNAWCGCRTQLLPAQQHKAILVRPSRIHTQAYGSSSTPARAVLVCPSRIHTHKHAKAAHPDPSWKGKPHGLLLLLTGLKNSDWPDGTVPFSLQRLSLAMYRVLELSLSLPPAVPVRRYPVMFAVWPPMLRMTTCAVLPAPGMGVTLWMMSLAWVLPLHSAGAGDCRDDRHSVQQHRCGRRRRSCMQNT